MFTDNNIREAEQYIADVYHCLGCWGQKMTDDDMLLSLQMWREEADPEDYVPAADLYRVLAAYWNSLCIAHPH